MVDRSLGFIAVKRFVAKRKKTKPKRKQAVIQPKPKRKQVIHDQAALLIGIEYVSYAKRKVTERLPGCHYDIGILHGYLLRRFKCKDITLLADKPRHSAPTNKTIKTYLRSMIDKANQGTKHILIYYSGHGTQVRDTNRDEKDKQDEAIVPCDYLTAGMITDDWLYHNFICKLPAGCTCTIITDCCNSGTVLDLKYRYLPETKKWVQTNVPKQSPKASVIALSGCADPQTSASAYNLSNRRKWRGAMTWALERMWGQKGINVSAEDCLVGIRKLLKEKGFKQNPQLCSSHNPRVGANVNNTPLA